MKIEFNRIIPIVGGIYELTNATRETPISRYQRNTVIEDGVAYQTMKVKVNNVDDGEDKFGPYLYFGYEPVYEDEGMCGFGHKKLYLDDTRRPPYGLVGIREV